MSLKPYCVIEQNQIKNFKNEVTCAHKEKMILFKKSSYLDIDFQHGYKQYIFKFSK